MVSSFYFLTAAAAAKSLQSCQTLCDPIDGSPQGSPHPSDSPGKNTGVGCHFLLQCMKVKSESEVAQSCPTPSTPMDCSLPGSSVHEIFPGKSTGVGCHCLLPSPCIHILYSTSNPFFPSALIWALGSSSPLASKKMILVVRK